MAGEDRGSEGSGTGSATRMTKALKGFVITNGWLPSIAKYAYKFP